MTAAPNATRAAGELLPCPFCGLPMSAAVGREMFLDDPLYLVKCRGCDAAIGKHASRAEAIAAWNRRAPLAPAVVDAGTLAGWHGIAETLLAVAENEGWSQNDTARRAAVALRAACDALATAAQPARAVPSPDREAVESGIAETRYHDRLCAQERAGSAAAVLHYRRAEDAQDRLLALIYGDAPADASAESKARAVRAAGGGA